MRVLLVLNKEIKLNIGAPVLNEAKDSYEGFDIVYEINPKVLKRAVKLLLNEKSEEDSNCNITEIVTLNCCNTERKFRSVFADTIDYLEKSLNKDKTDLPTEKKPEKKIFDISDKDKELLKKKDVTKLEIALAKLKPKCKSLAFGAKEYWKYLKEKTYCKKKIPVYLSSCGFVFSASGIRFLALDKADEYTVKNAEKFLDNSTKNNDKFITKEYDSKSKKLITGHIPLLADNKREVIRKTVQNVAVVVFVVAGIYLLYNSVYKSVENTAIQSEIQSIYYDGEVSEKAKTQDHAKNFKKLKSINNEIVAWISIPNTKVDYPVLYHKEDTLKSQYYLYKNYEGNYSDYGSIFVDFRSSKGTDSKNIILHGHHMMDGSMFSNLLKYGKTSIDMDFYKKSPTVTFSTPKGTDTYKIISVIKTTGNTKDKDFFNYIQGDFFNNAEFLNYVYNVRARSMVNCPVDVNENDKLLTLSTCSYEVHENYRTVVVARKVRKGESKNVPVSKATKNSKAYFPSDFYYRYGGTQPKLTSFKEEYKKGRISWYDGEGKIKGKEDLTGGKFAWKITSTTETSSTKPTTSTTKPKEKTYTVKFLDSKGKIIKSQRVKEKSSAKAPKPPTKASTKYYRYTFLRWNKSFSKVNSNLTIKPIYKKTKIPQPKPTSPKPTTKPKPTSPTKTTKPVKPTQNSTTKPTTKPATATTTTMPATEPVQEEEAQ